MKHAQALIAYIIVYSLVCFLLTPIIPTSLALYILACYAVGFPTLFLLNKHYEG